MVIVIWQFVCCVMLLGQCDIVNIGLSQRKGQRCLAL